MRLKSFLTILSTIALLANVRLARADDPPLEGAPMMTGTNVPAREHATHDAPRPHPIRPHPKAVVKAPATNLPPQVLQSAPPAATPKVAKAPGLVAYGCYGFSVNGQPFWVIPERYLHDLTQHYQFQYAEKIILPEP